MEVNTKKVEDITVVEVIGDVDAKTAPELQKKVLGLAEPGSKIIMDMTQVPYMSSAGLRVLLSIYRTVENKTGKLVLVGLSEEVKDTMSVTGFLDFFTEKATLEEGIAAIK